VTGEGSNRRFSGVFGEPIPAGAYLLGWCGPLRADALPICSCRGLRFAGRQRTPSRFLRNPVFEGARRRPDRPRLRGCAHPGPAVAVRAARSTSNQLT